jgi:hypothetical protein
VIDFDRRLTVPAGAFLEHHAPGHRTSDATSPPLTGSASAVSLPPAAIGAAGADRVRFAGEAVRGRPFTADFGRSPFGYGLRVALSQRRCRSASNRVSTSGATCEYISTTRFGR